MSKRETVNENRCESGTRKTLATNYAVYKQDIFSPNAKQESDLTQSTTAAAHVGREKIPTVLGALEQVLHLSTVCGAVTD